MGNRADCYRLLSLFIIKKKKTEKDKVCPGFVSKLLFIHMEHMSLSGFPVTQGDTTLICLDDCRKKEIESRGRTGSWKWLYRNQSEHTGNNRHTSCMLAPYLKIRCIILWTDTERTTFEWSWVYRRHSKCEVSCGNTHGWSGELDL